MTYTDKNIVEIYSRLLEGLSNLNKIELIENLSKSLKVQVNKKENEFYDSFGTFESDKSAEDIIIDIKSNRKFIKKDIKF